MVHTNNSNKYITHGKRTEFDRQQKEMTENNLSFWENTEEKNTKLKATKGNPKYSKGETDVGNRVIVIIVMHVHLHIMYRGGVEFFVQLKRTTHSNLYCV